MNEYVYGSDILGADGGSYADMVSTHVCAERPLSAERASGLIVATVDALAEMNFYDQDEETRTWRDGMAAQLSRMYDTIEKSGKSTLPNKAADILCQAMADVAGMLDEGEEIYPDFERIKERLLMSIGVDVQVLGRQSLGPRGQNVFGELDEILGDLGNDLIGVAVLEWDNHNTYEPGEIVYFNQKHWRALREVTPPFLPALMKGDEPGSSDAWREISTGNVYGGDVTDDVIGMFDIGAAQLKMNALKPVTVGAAKALIKGGLQVMAVAEVTAHAHDLPLDNTRQEVIGHLEWHQKKLSGLHDDKAIYDSGDDAKKWAMQAYIEANSVEEGAAYIDEAWSQMWTEIGQNLAEIPRQILKLPGKALQAATGIPWWAWYAGGATLVGLVGYAAYKILAGPTGGALVGAYFGARR